MVRIAKIDVARNLVFGWASIAVLKDGTSMVDTDGEMIAPEDLEEAMYDFVLESREGGVAHDGPAPARLVEAVVLTKEKQLAMGIPPGYVPEAAWVGFRVPPETFAKVRAGKLPDFSIQGRAVREEV